MAVSTYIITLTDFKTRAMLSQNINTDRLKAEIGPVQDTFAIKILCNDFYNEVLSAISGTAVPVITTLLPRLRDYLVYKTYAEYLVSANILMTPAGARVSIDATSAEATDKQVSEMIAQAERRANMYQDRLVNFLELNQDDYPTWRDSICNCLPRRTNLNNQFSLVGNNRRKAEINLT